MKKKNEWLAKMSEGIGKLQNSAFLQTLMKGVLVTMPAIMVGSIATILMNLQIAVYQDWLASSGVGHILEIIGVITINFTALYTAFGISYAYADTKVKAGAPAGVLALVTFFLMTPIDIIDTGFGFNQYSLPTEWFGAQGVFSAMIIGFTVAAIFSFIKKKNWVIKMPDTVPPIVSSSFAAIIPGFVIITLFAVLSWIFANTVHGSMHQAIYSILQTPINNIGVNIWSVLIVAFIAQILWVFGIHGPMVVMSIAMIAWRPADLDNLMAYNAGQALPNVVGFAFYHLTTFGGGGLGLAICLLISKSKKLKTVGRLGVIPSIFGITEPLIFGIPIVGNFKLAIPHVFVPMISVILGYIGIITGILPRLSGVGLPPGVPVVLYGFLQGGVATAIFQFLLVGVWVIGYYPFVKSLDKDEYALEQAAELENDGATVKA